MKKISNKTKSLAVKEDSHIPKREFYSQVQEILSQARSRAYRSVNFIMVEAYWNVGRLIVEEEQKGRRRAGYGKNLVKSLADRLTSEFGKGFTQTNLWYMRQFFWPSQFSTHCVEN